MHRTGWRLVGVPLGARRRRLAELPRVTWSRPHSGGIPFSPHFCDLRRPQVGVFATWDCTVPVESRVGNLQPPQVAKLEKIVRKKTRKYIKTAFPYLLYSALGCGSTLPHELPMCGAPTDLLPSLLLANGELFVSAVPVWSRSLSCFLVRWSVICCQRLLSWLGQRRIARRVSQSQFWRALLGMTLGLFGAFPTLVGGHHWSLGATFLGS